MGIPYQYAYPWELTALQHEYKSTPTYEYLCEFSQYPVYYTLGIININQLCVLGIDAKKHRQKGCNKNVVKLFLLQPFCCFLMFRLYMCSCKLVQACSIYKSIIFRYSRKLVQACSNFKEPYIQRFISLKTIYPM